MLSDEPGLKAGEDLSVLAVRSDLDVEITVYDARGLRCFGGTGETGAFVPRGLYRVHLERCGAVREHIVEHPGEHIAEHPSNHAAEALHVFAGPPIETAAPLAIAVDGDAHARLAARWSVDETCSPIGAAPHDARLFVFVRWSPRAPAPARFPSDRLTLHDVRGRQLLELSGLNAAIDARRGYLAFACRAAPGCYRLRTGRARRDLAIPIPRGRAAQVFLGDRGALRVSGARVYLPAAERAFNPAGMVAATAEIVLRELRRRDGALPWFVQQHLEIAADDAAFAAACAHLAHRRGDTWALERLLTVLRDTAPDLPDLAILEMAAGAPAGAARSGSLGDPPLLRASLELALSDGLAVATRSALGEAARTGSDDSVWCTWSGRWWDERWIDSTVEVLRSRPAPVPMTAAEIARGARLPLETVERVVEHLERTLPQVHGRAIPLDRVAVPGYTLHEILGRGWRSTILRATREVDGRAVALKLVPSVPGRAAHEPGVGVAPDAADSPFVRAVRGGVLADGTAMWRELELCDEGSLFDRLAVFDGPMPVPDACDDIQRALAALARLHARGETHGGIHPGELLRRRDGTIALADRLRSVPPAPGDDERTVGFVAPELLVEGAPPTAAADVWSAAATLYFLLTLELPRERYADQRGREAAAENPVVPIEARCPDVPPQLAACLARALARDPAARFVDAGALREALAAAMAPAVTLSDALVQTALMSAGAPLETQPSADTGQHRAVPPREAPPRLPPTTRRTRAWAAVALVASAIACALGAYLVMRRSPAAAETHEARERLARTYVEQGHALLLDGRPLQALPYLAEARRAGADSLLLRTLFRAALEANASEAVLGHTNAIDAAMFTAGDAAAVLVLAGGTLHVWRGDAEPRVPSEVKDHRGQVTAVALDGAGVRIAYGTTDGSTHLRIGTVNLDVDVPSAARSQSAPQPVRDVALTRDGLRGATASGDAALVWDAARGGRLAGIEGAAPARGRRLVHGSPVLRVAFSADGARIVTAAMDGTARVWDALTARPLTAPLVHRAAVTGAAFSPDDAQVITASEDGTARLWDARTGRALVAPLEHRAAVTAAAFSPDGTRVITASEDGTARLWDPATGAPLAASLEHGGAVLAATFSPDGRWIVTASRDRTARIWDATTGTPAGPRLEHAMAVTGARFSADGTRVVTASEDRTARVWRVPSEPGEGRREPEARLPHGARVSSLAVSASGQRIATGGADGVARVWDARTHQPLGDPLVHGPGPVAVVFQPAGTTLATLGGGTAALLWRPGAAAPLELAHPRAVTGAAFSADGRRLVTMCADDTARVWDVDTGRRIAELPHGGALASAAFSADGRRIATAGGRLGSDRGQLRVWDAASGARQVLPSLAPRAEIVGTAFTPDGLRLVTLGADGAAQIWEARSGLAVTGPLLHRGSITGLAFAPGGARMVTASQDGSARVWDTTTGKLLAAPLAHAAGVATAVFSGDGERVVTASADGTARVWEAASGEPLLPPFVHAGAVAAAAFSADGEHVLTASGDAAYLWSIAVDTRALSAWLADERAWSPYQLVDGVLLSRAPESPPPRSSPARCDDGDLELCMPLQGADGVSGAR